MTDVSGRSRVQSGVPTGGQFSTEARSENPDLVFADVHRHAAFQDEMTEAINRSKAERGAMYSRATELAERETALDLARRASEIRANHPQAQFVEVRLNPPDDRFGETDFTITMNRALNAEGKHVTNLDPNAKLVVQKFGSWTGTLALSRSDLIDIDKAIDLGEQEARKAEKEQAAQVASLRPTVRAMRSQMALLDAVDHEQKVEFSEDDGDTVVEAVVRHGFWAEGGERMASVNTDPRDAYVRLTTSTGLERWMPFARLAELHENERAYFRSR